MMFKKTKKLSPPPTAPNLEEILEDLETFHIEKPLPIRTRILNTSSNANNSGNSSIVTGNSSLNEPSQEWWKVFETFLYDVEDLNRMKSDINGFKIKLESSKLEINTLAKNIQNDIDESLEKTKIEIKDDE